VTIEGLMPLTALKQLRNLVLSPVLAPKADVKEFWEAMTAVRHEMGFVGSKVSYTKSLGEVNFVF
jgi:hypothetical protein